MKTPCPYTEYLQIQELAHEGGTARMLMPFREEVTNPNGFVQGGAIASLADAALAAALSSLIGDALFFTAKMEVRFRSPTKDRALVCDSIIESKRGNFFFGKATVREQEGNVVAEVQASFSAPEQR